MANPFTEKYASDARDSELVEKTLRGNRTALEELITRHQAWIYNVALRMVMLPQDAEDVTQEVLIKMISRLSSFKFESAFRTWLYRIVANHVIDMERRRPEQMVNSFEEYWKGIEATPDADLPDPKDIPADMNLIVEETRISCVAGMLLCLDRERRLAFVLGSLFGVSAAIGSEIIGISEVNYRQRLSRARRSIANFMNDRCGLVKKDNPCHCANKTKAMIDSGFLDPDNLLFSVAGARKVKEIASDTRIAMNDLLEVKCQSIFRDTPFYESPDFVGALRSVLNSGEFDRLFNLYN
jgi:RNA polymerase sigma factor (sigma-70 family)